MKKIFFLACLVVLTFASRGQLLLHEPFDYAPHASNGLYLQSSGAWLNVNTGDSILVTSGSLSYPGLPASTGNKVFFDSAGIDNYRLFAAQTTGSVYFSFIFNLTSLGDLDATGGYFTGLIQAGSTTAFGATVWTRTSTTSGKYNIGISTRSNSTVTWLVNDLDPATSYFVVSSYDIVSGSANDIARIWLNPSLGGSEPAANATAAPGTDFTALGVERIFLRQDSGIETAPTEMDEIRVGTTWSSVTPVVAGSPTLTAGTVADFGNITVSTNSSSQSFNLSGANLTGTPGGNISVTAPSTDFQVSNDNSTWGNSTTIAYTSATLASTPVYVRFTPQSTGLKSGNITISGGGANTSVAVSGTGVPPAPPAAPVATAATAIGSNSFTANWNPVGGATGYKLDVYTLSGGTSTDTIAGWYFPINNSTSLTAGIGNVNNVGIQTVSVTGANPAVTYPSGPSGASGTPNPYSVSTNTWDNGADTKYWQINVNTTGATNIKLSSLQGSSSTGPRDFKVQYRVGAGGTWTDVAGGALTFTVAVAAGNLATWGAINNLALPADANNEALVSIRWIQTSNTAINASPVASGGTSRISAIYVRGDVGSTTTTYVHQDLAVGNVTNYNVTGLSPSTTYYYVVRAENANGASANSNEISLTTTAGVTPTLSANTLTSFGNVCINTSAGPNSFTISGTNLTSTDVVVAALPGFTYSTTSGGTYTTTLTLPQAGGVYSQEVFVKFDPTLVQSYNGNIVVSGGGASPINVAASGAGVNTMPTLTSGSASAVTQTSATVAGNISSIGCSAISAYGIEWSTTSGFANGTGTAVAATNLAGGNFSSDLSGLAGATTYYYHAYATNAGGTAYGSELSFTTISPNPTITASTLTSFGDVCIGIIAGPNSFTISGTNLSTTDINVGPLTGYVFGLAAAGPYTTSLIIPQPGGTFNQTIYVQFLPTLVQSYNGNITINGGGISAPVNVAASGSGINTTPTVATGAASAITITTANLAGNFTFSGCSPISAYGIEYSTTNGFANGSGTQVASTNEVGGNYTVSLSGLTASTTYYYKAYATNNGGTSYGVQQSFTTAAPPPPSLNATALTGFGSVCINTTAGPNSFTINGTNLTTAAIVVGPLAGFTFSETPGGLYANIVTIIHTGGTQSKTVYVKFNPIVVQSYNGNISITGGGTTGTLNIVATGAGVNTVPSVTTGPASNVTSQSVTLVGNITASLCTNISAYGIEFSGINGFADGSGTKVPANNLSGAEFSSVLNNLVPGATYYYKAYATNGGGTGYGAQQSFTVASLRDGFNIYPVPVAPGADIHFTLNDVTPGNYSMLFYNNKGELVLQHNLNIQSNFINQTVTIPGTMGRGVYQVHLINTNGLRVKRTILVL